MRTKSGPTFLRRQEMIVGSLASSSIARVGVSSSSGTICSYRVIRSFIQWLPRLANHAIGTLFFLFRDDGSCRKIHDAVVVRISIDAKSERAMTTVGVASAVTKAVIKKNLQYIEIEPIVVV